MSEQQIIIEAAGADVPCSLYSARHPRAVVLFGHGLGVDRYHETVLGPVKILNEFGFSVLVPELPLHGERAGGGGPEWSEVVSRWQQFWAGNGRDHLLTEWQKILAYVQQTYGLPVVYFGLSLGTQYGIFLLSQTGDVNAAVLGLFGSEPPPKSIVMNHSAPEVSVPIYFIQKLDDEIHIAENVRHLYESLGSSLKVLDATPGMHGDVSGESIRKACRFLVEQIEVLQK